MALHIQVVDDKRNPLKNTKVSVFGSTVISGGETSITNELGYAILSNAIRGKTTLIVGSNELQMIAKFDYTKGSINIIQIIGNTLALVGETLETCNA